MPNTWQSHSLSNSLTETENKHKANAATTAIYTKKFCSKLHQSYQQKLAETTFNKQLNGTLRNISTSHSTSDKNKYSQHTTTPYSKETQRLLSIMKSALCFTFTLHRWQFHFCPRTQNLTLLVNAIHYSNHVQIHQCPVNQCSLSYPE